MNAPRPIRLQHEQVFINLPVTDLAAQRDFYLALGFKQNLVFSDETTNSFEISDHIVVMLLQQDTFSGFHDRETVAANGPREVLNALGAESTADVDELIRRAKQAGGTITREPEAQGPMYGAAFDDLEGHGWEIVYMDPSALE
ncbi:VOC family protein [Corynebacterium sp. A21]|uniref:VOC family protein n=1 Tax=Corynebacterium sp. A21 TaxID=3457318 RepID=UPI003FD5953C